jgi:hypothetical protein
VVKIGAITFAKSLRGEGFRTGFKAAPTRVLFLPRFALRGTKRLTRSHTRLHGLLESVRRFVFQVIAVESNGKGREGHTSRPKSHVGQGVCLTS